MGQGSGGSAEGAEAGIYVVYEWNLGQDGLWLWDRLLSSELLAVALVGLLGPQLGAQRSEGMRPQTHLPPAPGEDGLRRLPRGPEQGLQGPT